jgi:hypothetical protein
MHPHFWNSDLLLVLSHCNKVVCPTRQYVAINCCSSEAYFEYFENHEYDAEIKESPEMHEQLLVV